MEKMKYLVLMLLLSSCGLKGAPTTVNNAGDPVEVQLMFEKDGCRVYKFYDGGRHFFTTCGETITSHTESCGKGCTRTYEENNRTSKGK